MEQARGCLPLVPLTVQIDSLACPAILIERSDAGVYRLAATNVAFRSALPDMDALGGAALSDVFPPSLARRLAAHCLVATTVGGPVTRDVRFTSLGRDVWWRLSIRMHRTDRFIGTAQDVTDLKEFYFRQTEESVSQAEIICSLRSLAGMTMHDTRVPLANLASLAEIILDEFKDLSQEKRHLIEASTDVARSALRAVESLMDGLAIPDPRAAKHEIVAFGDLCRDVVALVDPAQKLEIVFPEALIETDSVSLQIGLRNLVDNASRYADRVVEILLDPAPEEGMIVVVVADDGPGFAKGQDPLSAVGRTSPTDGRKIGLGAVLRLIGSAGGSITPLPPRLGRGATVRIALPGRVVCVGAARSTA